MNGLIQLFLRYLRTIYYLKPVQIYGRIWQFIKRKKIDKSNFFGEIQLSNNWIRSIESLPKLVGKNSFIFLNEAHQVLYPVDWNNPKCSKLWLYNLHYFDDLNCVDSDKRASWHNELIQRWINENSIGQGNGWEPYPTSIRIVNWIKWAFAGNQFNKEFQFSLVVQIRFLSNNLETYLLGNHLFSNAKALIFSGVFFNGSEANKWYRTGINILKKELNEQILSDGGHFELSTMYHSNFLEDLIDIVNLHKAYKKKISFQIEDRINKMFHWMQVMNHPDGDISFFNDSALFISPTLSQLSDYWYRVSKQSLPISNSLKSELINLESSGYTRVQKNNFIAIIDRANVGPAYLPSHAHADTLSFELSIFEKRLIVNPGVSQYRKGIERTNQRSTRAHSTVVIDDQNSSDVWSSFRVSRRAKVFDCVNEISKDKITISAYHDGYKYLAGSPIHKRDWIFHEKSLEIIDSILGRGSHKIEIILPLHPKVSIVSNSKSSVKLSLFENQIEISFYGEGILKIEKSNYHPEFGLSIQNIKLVFQVFGELPLSIKTIVSC